MGEASHQRGHQRLEHTRQGPNQQLQQQQERLVRLIRDHITRKGPDLHAHSSMKRQYILCE
jgi:hypothetical protein